MSKDAIIGSSMWNNPPEEDIKYLDKALKAYSVMIQQKLMDARKSDQLALILTGTNETDNDLAEDSSSYQNIVVAKEFQSIDMSFIRYINDPNLELGNQEADCIDAIVVATDMLIKKTKGKKFTRKIYLLTDANGPVNMDGFTDIVGEMKALEIQLTVIGFGFHTEEELETMESLEQEMSGCQQSQLAMYKLVKEVDGQVLPINEALQILSHFRSKTVRQVTTFRGNLSIGKSIQIPIFMYTQSTQRTLPTAKKGSAISMQSEEIKDKTMEVIRNTSYFTKDEASDVVEKEQLVKAYRYGKTLVPFNESEEKAMSLETSKGLEIIGFVPVTEIDRESFMGSTYAVTCHPEIVEAQVSLSSFIHAMFEKDACAIARYVRHDNASPKLVCLMPHIKAEKECLIMNILPFSEDVRRFTFPGLPKEEMTAEQSNAFDEWMGSMDLMTAARDEDGDPMELFKPRDTYNVAYQAVYQAIQERVLHPDKPLKELDEELIKHISPLESKKAAESAFTLHNLYKLEMVEKEEAPAARIFASNDFEELEKSLEGVRPGDVTEKSLADSISAEISSVGTADPIGDFNSMINNRKRDLVSKAIKEMSEMIIKIVNESFGDQMYAKACECVVALRKGSVQEQEWEEFNNYLGKLKSSFKGSKRRDGFWQVIKAKEISLISSIECGSSSISPEEKSKFLEDEIETAAPVEEAKDEQEDDDMVDLFIDDDHGDHPFCVCYLLGLE
ncbi:Ku70/Ku80 beta-barrel domain-containing protein [Rozella allomycis CSF55]|uniref:ATP-dependent DNA helicase II subunit 2 n=1 Tax=Rozella allomycis (strain CSF55) TaxID=988480 RepID=A0A075AQU9_ROZAC|nr:Ku70/Ku80 beta-barrel domain-containing protein [Rozella allomycis CSF55]|eukprot:EPZ30967.1 Ku70/Ku80 beta-barrel domain-containing protein [Rozella allomycis CSF55]